MINNQADNLVTNEKEVRKKYKNTLNIFQIKHRLYYHLVLFPYGPNV